MKINFVKYLKNLLMLHDKKMCVYFAQKLCLGVFWSIFLEKNVKSRNSLLNSLCLNLL